MIHGNALNPDPSGFSGGLNFYAYANGNPVSYFDPLGLCASESGSVWSWVAGAGNGGAGEQLQEIANMVNGDPASVADMGIAMGMEFWRVRLLRTIRRLQHGADDRR